MITPHLQSIDMALAKRQGCGVITTTAIPMRQIQLGLKYSF